MSLPKLKNYTTKINYRDSINKIENLLFDFGAVSVHKSADRDTRIIKGVSFIIHDEDDCEIPVKLEVTEDQVVNAAKYIRNEGLKKEYKVTAVDIRKARDTVWKMFYELIYCQLSMNLIQVRTKKQIFLADLYDSKSNMTLIEKIESGDGNLKKLLEGK